MNNEKMNCFCCYPEDWCENEKDNNKNDRWDKKDECKCWCKECRNKINDDFGDSYNKKGNGYNDKRSCNNCCDDKWDGYNTKNYSNRDENRYGNSKGDNEKRECRCHHNNKDDNEKRPCQRRCCFCELFRICK